MSALLTLSLPFHSSNIQRKLFLRWSKFVSCVFVFGLSVYSMAGCLLVSALLTFSLPFHSSNTQRKFVLRWSIFVSCVLMFVLNVFNRAMSSIRPALLIFLLLVCCWLVSLMIGFCIGRECKECDEVGASGVDVEEHSPCSCGAETSKEASTLGETFDIQISIHIYIFIYVGILDTCTNICSILKEFVLNSRHPGSRRE